MYEVNIFMGTGAAMAGNEHSYPAGERHALLIFSRQPEGSELDWLAAESIVTSKGWFDVQLQEGSVVNRTILDCDPDARPCYEQAMEHGWALIVFSDALDAAQQIVAPETPRFSSN